MPRLFVAALPDQQATDVLSTLAIEPSEDIRPVGPERWHVTLRFIGEVDATEVARSLRDVVLPHCTVQLGPATLRLGGRQIVVPAAGVEPLAAAVHSATAGLGRRDDRPFFGHLTLARTKPGAGDALVGLPVSAQFDVHHVVLMASDLRPDGAAYSEVERFPTSTTS